VVLSGFTLTPIDSMAFEYQLSDLKFVVRLAVLRFLDFDPRIFRLSSSDVIGLTRTRVPTKHLPLLLINRRLY
jgi:hypothetical protein